MESVPRLAASCWRLSVAAVCILCLGLTADDVDAQMQVAIGDMTVVEGWRTNTIKGVGLVVGLNGTGGSGPRTRQAYMNMLERFGLRSDPDSRDKIKNDTKEKTDNVSLVMVSALLRPGKRPGQVISATVTTLDDATSLYGGELIDTELLGPRQEEVYAVASGPLLGVGLVHSGAAASVQKNHPTAGRVENVIVEKAVCAPSLGQHGTINLLLKEDSFENSRRIADVINAHLSQHRRAPGHVYARDAGIVEVLIPQVARANVTPFLAEIRSLRVTPHVKARVVINERTGTVVIGGDVRLSRVAFSHANLVVTTAESPVVSQPAPLSGGQTTVTDSTDINVIEERSPITTVDNLATVDELAKALNALGATPADLSAIFQRLKDSGALHAELVFR